MFKACLPRNAPDSWFRTKDEARKIATQRITFLMLPKYYPSSPPNSSSKILSEIEGVEPSKILSGVEGQIPAWYEVFKPGIVLLFLLENLKTALVFSPAF